ncbi:MAG: septal ring lytic transglycosylase RlpA family protein [Candidatus Scalindua sp.]|nr:septal ring lytic transglycosylase RlpA family protein [Candidatus Scalindua sp.]
MVKYRSMRHKKVFSLLVSIACIIGCGSMNTRGSHGREADTNVAAFREVNSDETARRVVEKRGGSRGQAPKEEADRKEYYLNAADKGKAESEMIYRGEIDMNEPGTGGTQPLETFNGSEDSRKKSEKQPDRYDETGFAAFISDEYQGVMTASGVRYDRNKMTAAHPSLPFDTKIAVTNLRNKRSVEVIIIDRFYPSTDRILNVSHRAAEELDLIESGVAKVGIRILTGLESGSN